MSQTQEPLLDIPERYEDVTAEWLTQALRAGGVLGDQTVGSFGIEPISAAKSRNSSLARINIEYEGHAEGLPDSVFAKFVSRIPGNRELAAEYEVFRTEISLYENLGDAIPMNMPRMYFGGARENSDVAVLLLEEIKGVSKAGLPVEEMLLTESEAGLALREVSKMHAKWWEDRSLDGYAWLATMENDPRKVFFDAYEESWRGMKDVLEQELTPTQVRIFSGLSSYLPTLISELSRMPATLCHGDFHVSNLLWDEKWKPNKVWAVDWQRPTKGPAIIDVSFFLGAHVSRADLHLVQQKYLPEYHTALLSQGVNHYGYERFLSDYRYGLLRVLTIIIGAIAKVDFARDDIGDFARVVIGNMAAAAEDAGCAELIS